MPVGSTAQIKIFLSDKYPLVRRGLREIFDAENDMIVVGETANVDEIVGMLEEHTPDVLITDLYMPVTSSLEMMSEVKRLHPDINILVLTLRTEDRFEMAATQSGASKYLTKDIPPEEIIRVVRELGASRSSDNDTPGDQLQNVHAEKNRNLGKTGKGGKKDG